MDSSKKYFILDTNVLLHNPLSINSFSESNVIIPIKVLEELDKFKKDRSERGRNARESARMLDKFRSHGNIAEGVKTDNGGQIIVSTKSVNLPKGLSYDVADDLILGCALYYKDNVPEDSLILFVSKDINARIKADALSIKAIDYEKQKTDYGKIYKGFVEIKISSDEIDEFYDTGEYKLNRTLLPNQFVRFIDNANEHHTALGRYNSTGIVKPLYSADFNAVGIKPLNMQQVFAFELLMDDNIKLVNLIGQAGTGKTLIAVAAGLKKVLEEDTFKKILVARPIIPMGKDIGYLPGSKEEKLLNWMQPIYDNLEFIFSKHDEKGKPGEKIKQFIAKDQLQIEALTYIRGRSIPDQYLIIDEAQNLTPLEVKTIISRAGEGTKIVLTGDPEQIDNPYLDQDSNGLSFVVDKTKESELVGSILLEKSERSKLASLAVEKL